MNKLIEQKRDFRIRPIYVGSVNFQQVNKFSEEKKAFLSDGAGIIRYPYRKKVNLDSLAHIICKN